MADFWKLGVAEESFEEFLELALRVIASEHACMPKTCPRCGGRMKFVYQALIGGEVVGDLLVYRCVSCGYEVRRFFPFPPEYARFFKKLENAAE